LAIQVRHITAKSYWCEASVPVAGQVVKAGAQADSPAAAVRLAMRTLRSAAAAARDDAHDAPPPRTRWLTQEVNIAGTLAEMDAMWTEKARAVADPW
jgi:hypothetical protein